VVAVDGSCGLGATDFNEDQTVMSYRIGTSLGLAIGLLICQPALPGAALAAEDPASDWMEEYIGDKAPTFPDPDAVVAAFKAVLAADDRAGMARLLGLDPATVVGSGDYDERFAEVRELASQFLLVKSLAEDRRILLLGPELWPFPSPIVRTDGQWAFDTEAGLEEVVNRRIGENELMAIETARGYVDAQEAYRNTDWDGDGVLEYAQELISTPGTYDGLYWPPGEGIPESPAGSFASDEEIAEGERSEGYFGYRYRILKGQGDNVVGDKYDYVINGNMIAGFALIARPVEYDFTGVQTFVVNQYGTVYQKDLGPNTAELADEISLFDPDDTWTVVTDVTQ
jgi:hypothetical protein